MKTFIFYYDDTLREVAAEIHAISLDAAWKYVEKKYGPQTGEWLCKIK